MDELRMAEQAFGLAEAIARGAIAIHFEDGAVDAAAFVQASDKTVIAMHPRHHGEAPNNDLVALAGMAASIMPNAHRIATVVEIWAKHYEGGLPDDVPPTTDLNDVEPHDPEVRTGLHVTVVDITADRPFGAEIAVIHHLGDDGLPQWVGYPPRVGNLSESPAAHDLFHVWQHSVHIRKDAPPDVRDNWARPDFLESWARMLVNDPVFCCASAAIYFPDRDEPVMIFPEDDE